MNNSKKYLFIVLLLGIYCLLAEEKELIITSEKEFGIPLTEALMRDHGILNRVLLVYEEIVRRIDQRLDFPQKLFAQAIDIIKSFIENYHEKLEKDYIFPIFEKNKRQVRLVKTLKNQHNQGREITAQLKLFAAKESLDTKDKKRVKNLLQKFITMSRPHEAREDTELFPQVRSLISKQEFKAFGEQFEKIEHALFGKNGFESIVAKVTTIEKELGINNFE